MFLFSCKDEIKLSSEATMTTLTLTIESKDYEITFKDKQGKIKLPYATKLPVKARVAAVTLSAKATGVKVGDTLTILASEPLTLTVTAEDETTTQEYTVTVQKADPNSEASITALTLTVGSTDYEVTFTGTQDTLRVVPYGTPIPARVGVKNIALSPGATTDAKDQLSVTNNAVTLTVTAEDKTTTQEYTVRLAVSLSITSFTFEVPDNESMALDTADHKRIVGKIDHRAGTITFAQQSAYVYRDKLKATFEVSEEGAAVQVAGADQESGITEQDFTSPVSYVVRAEGTETTYTVTLIKSTMATIENEQFRARLKAFVPAAFTGDQLDITHSDVTNYSTIDVSNRDFKHALLTSLKGIEFFTALDTLLFFDNVTVGFLDVSRNTALTTLDCSGNNTLTSLDVSANTALTTLDCSATVLASLDVRANTALTTLNCGGNVLRSLDVSANTALTSLTCSGNNLRSLNVSANTALTYLACSNNSLTSLDVRANTALTTLNCSGNVLRSLDVSANTALTSLYCYSNSLTSLDVSANTALEFLGCRDNSLISLNLSKNTALTGLNCQGNDLTSLDMTGMRSVAYDGALIIGAGTGTRNPLETLRVNTAVQDDVAILIMKTARKAELTITTVNDAGEEQCANYTPATDGGNCN